jgi:uncharacterized membrane protein YsdA (DUF1294 family)
MNRIAANQLMIEILIRLVSGQPADKATAREMARRLDEEAIHRLKMAAGEAAVLAENVFLEKRRKKRGDKSTA